MDKFARDFGMFFCCCGFPIIAIFAVIFAVVSFIPSVGGIAGLLALFGLTWGKRTQSFTSVQSPVDVLNRWKRASTPSLPTVDVKRRRVLTADEARFFAALKDVVPDDFVLLCNVRLADIVRIDKRTREGFTLLNKAMRKHVDFVLCSSETFEPMIVVELDGWNHAQRRQRQRDADKDRILALARIRVVRIASVKDYKPAEVWRLIESALQS